MTKRHGIESGHQPDLSPETLGGMLPAITVGVPEACRLTDIGRSKVYQLIAAGEIRAIKAGAIALVSMASITAFLAAHER